MPSQPLYEQFGAPTLLYRNASSWIDSPAAGPHVAAPWIRGHHEELHMRMSRRLMELDAVHLLTQLQNDPGYLKGIPINSTQKILASEREIQQRVNAHQVFRDDFDLETHDYYGNCLQIMKCRAVKEHEAKAWSTYVLRPCGSYRNTIRLSKLCFPMRRENYDTDDSNSTFSGDQRRHPSSNRLHPPEGHDGIDLHAPIRQIIRCGQDMEPGHDSNPFDSWSAADSLGWFMARTRTQCSVLRVTPSQEEHDNDDDDVGATIEEIDRIDFRELTKISNEIPRYCAGYRDAGGSFGSPMFAIAGSENSIHHVVVGYDGILPIQSYTFETITNQKQIEYSSHPMILWSSASLKRGDFGNMLFKLDMRSRSASRVWSASHANYMVDGMCTIRSFLQHPTKDHTAYATTSLGKLYELDTRMPMKEVTTWVLSGEVDKYRDGDDILLLADNHPPDEGLALHSPSISSPPVESLAILAIHKAPQAYGLRLYQSPLRPPRFETVPLEAGPYCDVSNVSCIARTTVYALPDYSRKIFHCGLASIHVPLEFLVDDSSRQDCRMPATHALCVLTLTSMGDIFCHTLIECDRDEPRQAQAFEGLPSGMAALPVPEACVSSFDPSTSNDERFIQMYLSNQYPVSSSAILPYVSSLNEIRPFRTAPIPSSAGTQRSDHVDAGMTESKQSEEAPNAHETTKAVGKELAAQPRAHWEIQRYASCRSDEVKDMINDAGMLSGESVGHLFMGVSSASRCKPTPDMELQQATGGIVPATVAVDPSETVHTVPSVSACVSFLGRELMAKNISVPALKERRSDISKDKIVKLEEMWNE